MIRKHFAGFAASALALAVSAQAFAGTVTTDGTDIVIKTKGGLEVATTDKQYSFKLGGRIQADFDSFDGFYTSNNERANEAYFRRARLEFGGNYKDWRYQMNVEFGDNRSNENRFSEATITYTGFSPINIKVGRFDPDYSLEKATSSKWVTTKERSAILDLASWTTLHENGMGIQVNGTTAGMFYGSASIQQQDSSASLEDEDGKDVNSYFMRGVFAPIVSETQVLHFGLDYATRSYGNETDGTKFGGAITSNLGVRGINENNGLNTAAMTLAPNDAGGAGGFDDDSVVGLEFAYMHGPFSVQSEYLKRDLSGSDENGDREATGYNALLAYTLTGESRIYKLDGAKFDAIKPANKQYGAWELFYRYDNLSVEDDDTMQTVGGLAIDESEAQVHTLGVNWYANEAVKVSLSYLMSQTEDDTVRLQPGRFAAGNDDDDGQAILMRAQYVF
ncbi:MAG: porin [Pseudomonas sp.]|uniref:OprO/OprP family phosphate-selective porin n=1 Tax=Pseudomonas TaxID=286 RepID=UPI000CC4A0F1|nr:MULTISPECIES: porin [Pseudomonas]MDR7023049.1 phosphate-selective porin OprO/OprP [Pseudomonas peli]PJE43197.1 MAG: porin [Pseudomonas sp.] [Pseudomonas sp. FEMGT703P]